MFDKNFDVCPIDDRFLESDFREQIAVLIPGAIQDGILYAHKSLVSVCEHSLASFDPENPGEGTWDSWRNADTMIEDGAVGFYHIHPPGCHEFSSQDWKFIEGLAQANGKRYIWHMMQPAGSTVAQCVCAHMRHRGHVDVYAMGHIATIPTDTIVQLPLPPAWQQLTDVMSITRMDEDE